MSGEARDVVRSARSMLARGGQARRSRAWTATRVAWVVGWLCFAGVAGCRWGFGLRGEDAQLADGADLVLDDAGLPVPCAADTDCGRCQRCETNYCQRATFVALGFDRRNSCALDERGDVWCWGRNDYLVVDATLPALEIVPRPRRRADTTGVSGIDVGWGVIYVLQSGTLRSRGHFGGNVNDSSQSWDRVYANNFNGCALTTAGAVYCSGDNQHGQLGRGEAAQQVQPLGQFAAPSTNWRHVAPGNATCAIDTNDRLHCVGSNNFGQLGRGTVSSSELTLAEVGGSGVVWSTAQMGENHGCGIQRDGTLWCWGENLIDSAARPAPVQVGNDADWSRIVTNNKCSCAVKGATALWCACAFSGLTKALGLPMSTDWTPLPITVDSNTDPAIGGDHACVRQNGKWVCWGDNTLGAVGVDELALVGPTPLCE
jgi:hypothetical protein